MARIARVVKLVRTVAIVTWRDIRSLGSLAGQNFLLSFLTGAGFFALLLLAVLLVPLSMDPMEKIPEERRLSWPVLSWEWRMVRAASVLLSPVSWLAIGLTVAMGWRAGMLVFSGGAGFYAIQRLGKLCADRITARWPVRIPALGGSIGAIMRLQWRTMLHTLDPYLAFALMASTEIYKLSGKPLDPAAPRIIALLVALAISTHGQVLLGIDGRGAERYRLMPIRGWRILLAKDLALLLLLGILVTPLDLVSGLFGGLAAIVVGQHNSVFKPVKQTRWRFTRGVLMPHGILQTVALLAVGINVRTGGIQMMAVCILVWTVSVFLYGWLWDRRYS